MLSFSYMLNVYIAYIHNAKKALNECKREHKKHKTSEIKIKLLLKLQLGLQKAMNVKIV